MRTSKPIHYDPEVIELLWNRQNEAESKRKAIRYWTLVFVLVVAAIAVEVWAK